MENERVENYDLDIKHILFLLKTRWWIIALCFMFAILFAGVYSFYIIKPVYKAESLLFVGREPNRKTGSYNLSELQVNQKLVMDYREIITSRLAAKAIIEKLGLTMNPDSLIKNMTVTTVNDSRMFKTGFIHTDAKLAAKIVNEMSAVILEKAEQIMDVDNVQVVDRAVEPKIPIKPNKKMNIAIAAVLGIMIGGTIILALDFFNNTIKNEKDVLRYLNLNIMGEIPVFEGEKRNLKRYRMN